MNGDGAHKADTDKHVSDAAADSGKAPVITDHIVSPTVPGEVLSAQSRPAHVSQDSITWTASEFIAHQKSGTWYLLFTLSALVIAGLVLLLTRDIFSSVAVAIGIGLLGFYADRKPRKQTYTLDASGLTIGQRHHSYHDFRSFSVVPEGAFLSIELLPLKRIAMYTTMYVDPADEDAIIDMISRYLPLEETHSNLADSFMRRIHF